MANWGNTDDAANSVSWAPALLNKAANTVNRTALYGNTTMGAFEALEVNAQVGLDKTEAAAALGSHAGWNLKTTGTGPLNTITISAGGTAYANADTITVAATGTGSVNATASLTTNATGGITSVTITNAGAGFTTTNPTVTITTSTGSAATLVATAGGRAGRVNYETLVAMGSIT